LRVKYECQAAALAVLAILLRSPAARADEVRVQIAPDSPTPNGKVTLLSAALPSSVPFDLDMPAADTKVLGGSVEIWPAKLRACSGNPSSRDLEGLRQYRQLAMVPTGTGADRVLRARISPLQINQSFCIRVALRTTIDAGLVDDFARRVTGKIVVALTPAAPPTPAQLEQICELAISRALVEMGLTNADTEPNLYGARRVAAAVAPTLAAYSKSQVEFKAAAAALAALPGAQAALPALPALPGSWQLYLRSSKRVVAVPTLPASTEIDSGTATDVAVALRSIQARVPSVGDAAKIERWAVAFEAVAKAQDDAKKKEAFGKLTGHPLPALPDYYFVGGASAVSSADVKALKLPPDLEALAAEVTALDAAVGAPFAAWKGPIVTFVRANKAQRDAFANVVAKQTAAQAASDALATQIASTIRADRAILPDVASAPLTLRTSAGEGATPDKLNYVSPVVGVAFGFPSFGGNGEPWLFPHAGANISFVAVDRTIPVGSLVDQCAQRISLIVSITLKDVSLPTRQSQPALLGGYPFLGVGYRLMQYTGVTIGAALYRASDINPASDRLHWGFAPSIGFSADLDVIGVIQQGIKGP
jgi:hypothetical protein